MRACDAGFSIVELTVALALTLLVAAAVGAMADASRTAFAAQPERADMQQRLRVGVDTLAHDLMSAGGGSPVGGERGPLADVLPPVMPFRRGASGSDPPGTFAMDTITVIGVPATAAQTTLAAELSPGAATLRVMPTAGCTDGVSLCGFAPGMTVLVFDPAGAFDLFAVTDVFDGAQQIGVAPDDSSSAYAIGAAVVEASVHTYYLKADPIAHTSQLMLADGAGSAAPVLDHVVGLAFEYGGEAGAPIAGTELADGPWLPSAAAAARWDADLQRVRTVRVTLRVEAALDALRGPAGALFANRGTAASPRVWVPDEERRFTVALRNMGAP
jgi:hypothetical protein